MISWGIGSCLVFLKIYFFLVHEGVIFVEYRSIRMQKLHYVVPDIVVAVTEAVEIITTMEMVVVEMMRVTLAEEVNTETTDP